MKFINKLYYELQFNLSYILNKLLKIYFNFVYSIISKFGKNEWRLFIEKFKVPGSLTYVMLNAPRWNTHAIIATIKPFKVLDRIEFTGLSSLNSCKSWTVVIYKQPSNKTVAYFSNLSISNGKYSYLCTLPIGIYTIGMRIYEASFPIQLPNVVVDHNKTVIRKRKLVNMPSFYPKKIFNRKSLFYSSIHAYIHLAMLKEIDKGQLFVQNEYLPVGNPETLFKYGIIEKGCILQIQVNEEILNNCLVYITRYNYSSFPIYSRKIISKDLSIDDLPYGSTYLLRIIRLNTRITESEIYSRLLIQVERINQSSTGI